MIKMYLFKLIGEDILDGDKDDFSHPFYTEIAGVISNDDVKYMEFGKKETMFMAIDESRFNTISAVFKKYFVLSITDVSDEVLSGTIQKEYPEIKSEIFDQFRLAKTTIDDVLDKISRSGIESLDQIDRMILDSSK